MRLTTNLSQRMESRLARYAVVAGAAAAAAVPATAAVVTVVLPTPVDIRNGYSLDLDQNGSVDFVFSAFSPTSPWVSQNGGNRILVSTGAQAVALTVGAVVNSGGSYNGTAFMDNFSATGVLFLGLRLTYTGSSTIPSFFRYGFAQFDPFNLYGFAYEAAPMTAITTFDVAPDTGVPEPATGALSTLALGAAALAASRRQKQ